MAQLQLHNFFYSDDVLHLSPWCYATSSIDIWNNNPYCCVFFGQLKEHRLVKSEIVISKCLGYAAALLFSLPLSIINQIHEPSALKFMYWCAVAKTETRVAKINPTFWKTRTRINGRLSANCTNYDSASIVETSRPKAPSQATLENSSSLVRSA